MSIQGALSGATNQIIGATINKSLREKAEKEKADRRLFPVLEKTYGITFQHGEWVQTGKGKYNFPFAGANNVSANPVDTSKGVMANQRAETNTQSAIEQKAQSQEYMAKQMQLRKANVKFWE